MGEDFCFALPVFLQVEVVVMAANPRGIGKCFEGGVDEGKKGFRVFERKRFGNVEG